MISIAVSGEWTNVGAKSVTVSRDATKDTHGNIASGDP